MLQKLNERIQGVIAWTIIILIAITFTFFGLDYYLQSRQSGQNKAEVNGEPISSTDFEATYRRARAQHDDSQLSAQAEKKLRSDVLQGLISNKLALQAARTSGFLISDAEVNAAILSIPQFKENGIFSSARFQQALSAAMFTPQTFKKELKQGMMLNQQRFAFVGTDFALPNEVAQFVRLFLQTRDYDYLDIPFQKFEKAIHVSEQDLKQYYEANLSSFMTKDRLRLSYVLLNMQTVREQIKIPDEEITQYYENNKQNFLKPASWQLAHIFIEGPAEGGSQKQWQAAEKKAEDIYKQLKQQPQDFNGFVKKYSSDRLSMAQNGRLPEIRAGETAYDATLVGLTEAGKISAPIKTKNGYEIFKVIAYQPAKLKSFDEVKNVIQTQLLADKAQDKYSRALETMSTLSFESPDSLQAVASALNLKVHHTKAFSREGGDAAITKNKKVLSVAFSEEFLQSGNNSEPLQMDNDSVIVFRVEQHLKPQQKSFSEVQQEIKDRIVHKKAEEMAQKLASRIEKADKDKQESLLKQNHLTWTAVKDAKRENMKPSAMINELAFSIEKPSQMASRLAEDTYVLLKLRAIRDGKMAQVDKELRKSIVQQIQANYGMSAYNLFMNALLKHAEIKRY